MAPSTLKDTRFPAKSSGAAILAAVLVVGISTLAAALLFTLGRAAILPILFGGDGGQGQEIRSATDVLDHLPPSPWNRESEFMGLDKFNAEYLNRHPPATLRHVSFVGPDVSSSGPDIVSVNPIGKYQWGAAAKSARTGDCFLFVVSHDPSDPRKGLTRYDRLAPEAECRGSLATPDKVQKSDWPAEAMSRLDPPFNPEEVHSLAGSVFLESLWEPDAAFL